MIWLNNINTYKLIGFFCFMAFKIMGVERKKANYTYTIRGEKENWSLLDLMPYFTRISKKSTHYSFIYDFGSCACCSS